MASPTGWWLLALACGSLVLACGGEERPKASLGGANGGGAGSAANGGGGSGGAAGAAGAGGTAGFGAAGAAGSGSGGAAEGGAPPVDTPCDQSAAFWATGAAFTFPTPKQLAAALGSLTYEVDQHPVTVVLVTQAGGTTLAVSASEQQPGGFAEVFVPGQKPGFVPATVTAGGFATSASQAQGWLRVKDQSGTKHIELANIDLSVTTASKCTLLLGMLTAVIPISEGAITLDLAGGSASIATLAGGGADGGGQTPDGGVVGWNLRLVFSAESTDFDFTSL